MNSIEKNNLNNAANTVIVRDLKGLLNCLSVKDLRYTLRMITDDKLNRVPKKELVIKLYDAITTEMGLRNIISKLLDNEFKLLKRIVVNDGVLQDNMV